MIRKMSKEECVSLLTGVRLSRLACASANQPYVIPMYLAYHQSVDGMSCLYGVTTIGQKVEWMRTNALVCVEFDEIASDTQWITVIIFGRYEELPAPPAGGVGHFSDRQNSLSGAIAPEDPDRNETLFAHQLLEARPIWWEPACSTRAASAHGELGRALAPIYFKVWIDQVTGYVSTRDADEGTFSVQIGHSGKLGWLRRALTGQIRETNK